MDIDITEFYNSIEPSRYSASAMELGDNAGRITWSNACNDSSEFNLLADEDKRDAFRRFVRSNGGWNEQEISAWSDVELNALFIQWISGDIRECLEWDVADIWANYEEMSESGRVSNNLFRGDDGRIYFSLYS